MKFFRLALLLSTLFLIFASCKTNESPTNSGGNNDATVSTTIAGVINDEAGQPISDVAITVTVNGIVKNSATTNKFGSFMILNAKVPSARCFILCKKNGYFIGSRAETPRAGTITEMRITLQSNTTTHTVNASSGGKITVGKASINFPANAFVTSSGTPYSGTVNVSARFIDPTAPTFYNSFSGDMTAIRTDGSQTELLSYGVLRVQIRDASGNELKIATGKKATLTYPLVASMQKDAPASMPLWYFDEVLGMWKEEGIATKSGNVYSGDVAHFTDWNCDVPVKTGIIKGRVVCKSNEGMEGIYITVGQWKVITDSNGYFIIRRAPINTNIVISINPEENDELTALDISVSPLSADEIRTLPDISLTNCPITVNGTIVDCNSLPIAGIVFLSYNGKYRCHFTTTGIFKFRIPPNTSFLVETTSFDGKEGSPVFVPALISDNDYNIGNIIACDNGNNTVFYDIHYEPGFDCTDAILSPDESLIVLSGKRSNIPYCDVYDVKARIKLSSFPFSTIGNFSEDGTKFLLRSWDTVCVVNPRTGEYYLKILAIDGILTPDGLSVIAFTGSGKNGSGKDKLVSALFSVSSGLKTKELSIFDTLQYSYRFVGFPAKNQLLLSNHSPTRRIITWDIEAEKIVSDITIGSIIMYGEGDLDFQGFSPNRTILGFLAGGADIGKINIFNTKTGTKIISSPYIIPGDLYHYPMVCAPVEVSNDSSIVIQEFKRSNKNDTTYMPPYVFGVGNVKPQKVLPTPIPIPQFLKFKYSDDSRFLVGILKNTITNPVNYVRVWKVK